MAPKTKGALCLPIPSPAHPLPFLGTCFACWETLLGVGGTRHPGTHCLARHRPSFCWDSWLLGEHTLPLFFSARNSFSLAKADIITRSKKKILWKKKTKRKIWKSFSFCSSTAFQVEDPAAGVILSNGDRGFLRAGICCVGDFVVPIQLGTGYFLSHSVPNSHKRTLLCCQNA